MYSKVQYTVHVATETGQNRGDITYQTFKCVLQTINVCTVLLLLYWCNPTFATFCVQFFIIISP